MKTNEHNTAEGDRASDAKIVIPEDSVEVVLIDRRLSAVPEDLAQFVRIQTLILHENLLTSLPDSLSALTNMIDVNLSRNKFCTAPECIAFMTSLKRLTLDHNQLNYLPDSYTSLLLLTRLDLRHNKLKNLPQCASVMTDLVEFYLYENLIADIPYWITSLGKLNDFRLEYAGKTTFLRAPMGIRNLPCALSNQKHLHARSSQSATIKSLYNNLYLANENLLCIDKFIPIIPQYTFVDLSNNTIPSLPDSFSELTHLKGLSINNNCFTSIPSCLEHLTNLAQLSVSKNPITKLDEWISKLVKLNDFEITVNYKIEVSGPEGITTLPCWRKTGDISKIKRYNHPPYHSEEQLKSVDHLLELWKPYTFLNLSQNSLSTLPAAFGQQTQLQSLDLGSNQFHTLPSVLSSLTGLTELCLGGNPAYEIPQWITRLSSLKTLRIKRVVDKFSYRGNHNLTENDRGNIENTCFVFAPSGLSKMPCWKQSARDYGNLGALTLYDHAPEDMNPISASQNM